MLTSTVARVCKPGASWGPWVTPVSPPSSYTVWKRSCQTWSQCRAVQRHSVVPAGPGIIRRMQMSVLGTRWRWRPLSGTFPGDQCRVCLLCTGRRLHDGTLLDTRRLAMATGRRGQQWTSRGNVRNSPILPNPYRSYDGREEPLAAGRRALRGGAWSNVARLTRGSCRNRHHPASFNFNAGCRVVVAPVL
jgi:hypothetical protein